MTWFVLCCVAMVAVAVALIARPLVRAPLSADAPRQQRERSWIVVAFVLLVPVMAAGLYATWTTWDWKNGALLANGQPNPQAMVASLEEKLTKNPQDVEGWLLLGRSYSRLGRSGRSLDAYQQAYDLTQGQNVEAITGLAEALVMTDEMTLAGRAGQLFEEALAKEPTNPKALWFGGIAALRAGKTELARDRLQALLARNPPEQLRSLLERQVQDLNQQLGATASPAAPLEKSPGGPTPSAGRIIEVNVALAPAIAAKVNKPLPLFILARDPAAGGPPLAVVRRSSAELPLSIALTEGDAMVPNRTLASVPRVEVVARLSLGGGPREQSGDFFGIAEYAFDSQGKAGKVKILIDRTVP